MSRTGAEHEQLADAQAATAMSAAAARTAPVALCMDAHYLLPACVLIHSLGRHWQGTGTLSICCLTDDSVSAQDGQALAATAERVSVDLTIRRMETPRQETRFPHLSPMAWAKLQVPAILAADQRLVLYLDTDMLACTSIHPLLRQPAGGMAVAAVRDYCVPGLGTPHLAANRFRITPAEAPLPYINSGLLLIDTAEWARQRIAAQLAAALTAEPGPGKLLFGDQDVLNAVLRGRAELLDPRWNVLPLSAIQTVLDFEYRGEHHFPDHYRAFLEASPWLVHYATGVKPWNDTFPDTRLRQLWRREAAMVQEILAAR